MNIKKFVTKKRAVSPILAAVLLIGLAITAGAVLFIVVIPLITAPGGGLIIDDGLTTLSTTGAHLVLSNEGSSDASVTNITIVEKGGTENANFTFNTFTVTKGAGKFKDYTFNVSEPLTAGQTYTITVFFTVGTDDDTIAIEITIT